MNYYKRIQAMSLDEMAEYHTNLIYSHINGLLNELGMKSYELTDEDYKTAVKEWKRLLGEEIKPQ